MQLMTYNDVKWGFEMLRVIELALENVEPITFNTT